MSKNQLVGAIVVVAIISLAIGWRVTRSAASPPGIKLIEPEQRQTATANAANDSTAQTPASVAQTKPPATPATANKDAYDTSLTARLWRVSASLVGLDQASVLVLPGT